MGGHFDDLFCCFHVSMEAAVTRYTAHGAEGWGSEGQRLLLPGQDCSSPKWASTGQEFETVKR